MTNIETATQRIDACLKDKDKSLRLSKLNLTSGDLEQLVPYISKNIPKLMYLDLFDNAIEALPESIGELTALRILYLWNNQLENLPKSMAKLNNLKYLDLSNNLLRALPNCLEKLTKLKVLDLGDNQLSGLPSEMLTKNYVYLDLSSNPLTLRTLLDLTTMFPKKEQLPNNFYLDSEHWDIINQVLSNPLTKMHKVLDRVLTANLDQIDAKIFLTLLKNFKSGSFS